MAREFEVVSNPHFRNLHVFLVHMMSRTPHIHRELEIGFVLKGCTRLRIGSENWLLNAKDGYRINPLDAHEFRSDGQDAVILAVQISPKIMDAFLNETPALRFGGSARLPQAAGGARAEDGLFEICVRLAKSYLEQRRGCEYECLALTAQLLAALNRTLPEEKLSKEAWLPFRRRMERMISITDYIDANFHRKLLLEEIAEREGLSMPHLSHVFRDTLGMSFQDYLKKRRFEYACPLILGTNRGLLDISLESGFSDTRYLIRQFQEEFGCTPTEYRRQNRPSAQKRAALQDSAQSILGREEAVRLLQALGGDIGKQSGAP